MLKLFGVSVLVGLIPVFVWLILPALVIAAAAGLLAAPLGMMIIASGWLGSWMRAGRDEADEGTPPRGRGHRPRLAPVGLPADHLKA